MAVEKRHIVTIVSDWGIRDYYAAVVRGKLLTLCPQATLYDISHAVAPFNLHQAAFILKNSYHYYPEGSWHIIAVETQVAPDAAQLIVRYNGHYFIGCDNGIYSILFDQNLPDEMYRIVPQPSFAASTFPVRDIYVPVLSQILNGADIRTVAQQQATIAGKRPFAPVINDSLITGRVTYIDRYENIHTDIHRSDIARMPDTGSFDLFMKDKKPHKIRRIHTSFSEVEEGEFVLLFVNDYLMIAMNHGNVAGLFGMEEGDIVRLAF